MLDYDGKKWLGEFLQNRTYAAIKDDGTKESRTETINRTKEMHQKKFPHLHDKIEDWFRQVHLGRVVPSMRSLQFGGSAIERVNARMYNCAFANLTSWDDFHDGFYLLMCGTGFGYSVKNRHILQLPRIKKQVPGAGTLTYTISDSKEGWADSVRLLLDNPYIEFDYSLIRPKGSLIASGGTASGPEALQKTHNEIRKVLVKAAGRKLTPLEAHDIMCHIADGVVVGGVRRAALICLFDADDKSMNQAKSGKWYVEDPQRARANNSAVIYRPGHEEETKEAIMSVMDYMFESGSGEPGISLTNHEDYGFNPSLRKGTLVYTKNGMYPIEELEGKEFVVRNLYGEYANATCWLSSPKEVLYEIKVYGGLSYYATKEHKWPVVDKNGNVVKKATHELREGDKLPRLPRSVLAHEGIGSYEEGKLMGFWLGDGHVTRRKDTGRLSFGISVSTTSKRKLAYLDLVKTLFNGNGHNRGSTIEFNSARKDLAEWFERFGIKENKLITKEMFENCSGAFLEGVIQGYFDADGTKDGKRICISSNNKELITSFHKLLGFAGIHLNLTTSHRDSYTVGSKVYEKKHTVYLLRRTEELAKSGVPVAITSVKKTDIEEPVWDVRVDSEDHCFQLAGCITGNCHEISLRDGGLCNLTEINVSACENLYQLIDAVYAATGIGTLQASYTYFPTLQDKWTQNAQDEALLGVSATGQADNWDLWSANTSTLAGIAVTTNKMVAAMIGIKPANRITTTKPSGSTSAWLGCCSGIHADHDEYYIRHVRMEKDHKIVKAVQDSEYPFIEVDKMDADKMVIGFPVKSSENAILKGSESAVELLERAKFVHDTWIKPGHQNGPNTHNVSLTVEYTEDEKDDIKKWMVENREHYAGISFLPRTDSVYEQMPFQSITKEEYESMVKKIKKPIDYSSVDWTGSVDERMGELACANGSCEIE